MQEAEESIRFYRNLHRNSRDNEILQQEMIKLRNSLNTSNNDENNDESISFNWSDLVRNPGRKAFIIGIVLSLVNQLCGCFAILNYTANIFEESGSNLSPNTSAIVVGVIQLLGSYVATILVDRAGRKVKRVLKYVFYDQKIMNLTILCFFFSFYLPFQLSERH